MSDLPQVACYATAHEMTTTPVRTDWLVHGVIPRKSFGLLFGDPGAGKSFLALNWSSAVATGLEWQGRPVQAGSVLYVAGEGFGGIGRRLAAWSRYHGTALDAAPMYVSKYQENFLSDDFDEETLSVFRQAPPPVRLIVVDTMARATPGMNEDRASEVSAFVDVCEALQKEFGATVLVLHHSPHSDKTRAKGSIALKGAVDFEFGLMTTTEDGVVRLTCTKLKDGEPPPDVHLRFESVDLGDGTTSAVLTACDAPACRSGKGRKVSLTANDKLFLATLGAEPVEASKVRTAFRQRHPSGNPDTAKKTFGRCYRRGLERGWFVEDGAMLIPSTTAIMKPQRDGQAGQSGQ